MQHRAQQRVELQPGCLCGPGRGSSSPAPCAPGPHSLSDARATGCSHGSQSKEGYAAIGGGSPLRRITDQQASALCAALGERGTDAHVYVAMRYWRPFTEDAVQQIKDDR
jgi:hypothetical protein